MIAAEKLPRVALAWIGVLLLSLAGLLSILSLEQLARALVASLAYYMVPTGVGLLLLPGFTSWRVAGLREGERLLAAYFVGLVALTLFYVIRDRYGFARDHRLWVDLGALFLAVVGWCLARRRPISHAKLLLTSRHALLAFSVYLVGYGVQFFVLSEYPRTDLFQFTHILKATEEFLKWDRLNPFVADSYIPAIPVMLRFVTDLTGAESLPTIWVLSLCSFVVRWMAIFMLVRRLPHMHRHAGLVAAVALPFFLSGVPTNGELVSLGACLILGLSLASMQAPQKPYKWLPLLVVPLSVMAATFLASAVDVAVYGGLILVAAFAVRFFAIHRRSGVLVVLGLMCFLMTPLHRSAIVFFAVAVVSAAGLSNFASRYWLNPGVVRIILAMVLALVGAVLLRWLSVVGTPDIGIALADAAKNSLGIDFLTDANRSVGVGSKIALFEVARSVGLLLYIFGFVGLLKAQPNRKLLSYQFVAGGLLLLIVLGFPFVYRAAFFLPIFLACIVVYQFRDSTPAWRRLASSAIAIYALALVAVSVVVSAGGGVTSASHGRITQVLLLIAISAVAVIVVMRAFNTPQITVYATILLVAILVDRQVTRAQFLHYAYPGVEATISRPVSHYDSGDVELAKALKSIPGEIVVVSDPLTMANMRGLGGHNSLLLFTNLDTGSMQGKLALFGYLKSLIASGEDSGEIKCPTVSDALDVLATGQAPDLTYAFSWLGSERKVAKSILAEIGYSNSLSRVLTGRSNGIVGTPNGHSFATLTKLIESIPDEGGKKFRFAVVFNARTHAWVAHVSPHSQSYFDEYAALDRKVLTSLTQKCGAFLIANAAVIVFNADGTIFGKP